MLGQWHGGIRHKSSATATMDQTDIRGLLTVLGLVFLRTLSSNALISSNFSRLMSLGYFFCLTPLLPVLPLRS
jgi:hypothetical protein